MIEAMIHTVMCQTNPRLRNPTVRAKTNAMIAPPTAPPTNSEVMNFQPTDKDRKCSLSDHPKSNYGEANEGSSE